MKSNNLIIRVKHQGKENRPYTLNDYNKVLSLRKGGISYGKIAQKVNISNATAQLWVKTSRKPRFLYAQIKQRKLKSKRLSPELAYIYGVLIGDGHLEKSKLSNRITLKVTDKEFAKKFYNVLKRWSGFKPTWSEASRISNHITMYGDLIKCNSYYYTVRFGSKQAVDFISNNLKCRTKDWDIPKSIKNTKNRKIIFSFFQGIFDSEGCAVYTPRYNKKRIDINMYGKQVRNLQKLLQKIGIESTVTQGQIQKQRGMYVLRILRKESIKLFAKNVGFTIKRKKKILCKILASYGS